jgi:succinate dehydrogenase / fumarate reductase cytochrome b subunit
MGFIGFHLWHGYQSAFQTLGLNHPKWTPLIKAVGKVYSVLVPLGFAIIPLWMYLQSR